MYEIFLLEIIYYEDSSVDVFQWWGDIHVLIKSVKVGRETKNLTTALGRRTSGHIWHVVKHSLLPLLDSPRSDPMQREFRP
jgi:hypothetical protein